MLNKPNSLRYLLLYYLTDLNSSTDFILIINKNIEVLMLIRIEQNQTKIP